MLLAGFGRSHELTDYCTNARGRQIQSSYSVYTGTYSPLATVYIYIHNMYQNVYRILLAKIFILLILLTTDTSGL